MALKRVLIIGAGIHGTSAAIELADAGYDVILADKNQTILEGTSGATHNRAHKGYHYPKSFDTARECITGLSHFEKKYPDVLEPQHRSYYTINVESNMNFKKYVDFCNNVGISCNEQWPSYKHLKRDKIEGCIITSEPIFKIKKLKAKLQKNIAAHKNITFLGSSEFVKFTARKDGSYSCILQQGISGIKDIEADIVINATYAYTNNILKILGLKEDYRKYKLQHTEVIVVRTPLDLPSITVMDGPYVSIMKHGGTEDQYLLYDVKNSVVDVEEGFFIEEKTFTTNYIEILKHCSDYFPFIGDLEYVESWWGTRPIPIESPDDERTTNIKEHKYPGVYSIFEGKFVSATMVAEELKDLIINK